MSEVKTKVGDNEVIEGEATAEIEQEAQAPAVVQEQNTAMAAPVSTDPMMILANAVEKGASPESLEKLMALQERYEANQARKAYVAAMAAFKENPPEIKKTAHVSYDTSGGTTEYRHAKLDETAAAIGKSMSPHGLSFRWDTRQGDKGIITVKCVITHELGHSESTELQSLPDQSGGKNSIQAVGSAVSYLQRYTLLAATGLAASDMDDDGQGVGQIDQKPIISETQATELQAMITDAGIEDAKVQRWLDRLAKHFSIRQYTDLHAENFETAKQILTQALNARTEK